MRFSQAQMVVQLQVYQHEGDYTAAVCAPSRMIEVSFRLQAGWNRIRVPIGVQG
jgi:hypothetical protein